MTVGLPMTSTSGRSELFRFTSLSDNALCLGQTMEGKAKQYNGRQPIKDARCLL